MDHFNEKNDDILVQMTLLGNEKAYEELVRRHESSVKGTAYKVTGNSFSAEDASQDAFVSAWINLDTLKNRESFGHWVCSIAKNCAKNILRSYKSAIPDISFDLIENLEISSDENDMEEILSLVGNDGAQSEKLNSALEALGEKIRQTVKLHYFDDLSIKEIAEKLSVPEGTVKWRLCEGRKQLRKEYGVMEKTYDENEALVARVMRQVEELKLWRLRDDKSGFEDEYRRVLSAVEELDESKKKQHALADVLLQGYWWLPGEKNDQTLARIKKAAEESLNEDVMQSVMCYEHDNLNGKKKIEYMRDVQIPYLDEHGFVKAKGYVYFWMAHAHARLDDLDEAIENYKNVLDVLTKKDVYYANALAAIEVEEKRRAGKANGLSEDAFDYHATGEVYKKIGDRLCLWLQPGYSGGYGDWVGNESIFWNASVCESVFFADGMKIGDCIYSSRNDDGARRRGRLIYEQSGVTVTTPAGVFDNCELYTFEGLAYGVLSVNTFYREGVGIVKQICKRHGMTNTWELSSYTVKGGSGLIPFAEGNSWSYSVADTDHDVESNTENRFDVISAEKGAYVIAHTCFSEFVSFNENTWRGNMKKVSEGYCRDKGNNESELLCVDDAIERAERLASNKRERLITATAKKVINRIFSTDPVYDPDFKRIGRWNFMQSELVLKNKSSVSTDYVKGGCSLSWKHEMWRCRDEGFKAMYNDFYGIIDETMGCIWSDNWCEGYHTEENFAKFYREKTSTVFDVLENESVETPAGRFENCRHVTFDRKGMSGGFAYRGDRMQYWYAEGIGIVKFSARYYFDHSKEAVWELVDYKGEGEGYFPVGDGLFRRYEPKDIGNGWHAYVEYFMDELDGEIMLISDQAGTQDREKYEADMEYYRKKDEEKNDLKS